MNLITVDDTVKTIFLGFRDNTFSFSVQLNAPNGYAYDNLSDNDGC